MARIFGSLQKNNYLSQKFQDSFIMMTTNYDVTIGIPVYNVERYIEKSILSALEQDFEGNIEILIVNDNSIDKSMDIVRDLQRRHHYGPNIHIINHSENKGVGYTRNTILDNAKGKYLFFLDSDDYITKDCIKKLYFQAELYDSDVVYGSVETVTPNGQVKDIGCSYLQQPNAVFTKPDELASFAFQNLHENLRNYVWNTLFRVSFLKEHELRFPESRFHEDVIFSTDMVPVVTKGVLLSDITYYYVIRDHSLSNLQGRSSIKLDEIKEFISIYTYVKNKNKSLKDKPYYEARCSRSMTQMLYIISGVLKNRKVISPALESLAIKNAMTHPATLNEILHFKKYKLANLAFYSLGILPSCMTVGIILLIAKYKHLL